MTTDWAVDVEGLTRSDDSGRFLVNNVSFKIRPGRVLGLVGVNGAGKTTTFRSLMGLMKAETRVLRIFGKDVRMALESGWVAWVPEKPILFDGLDIWDHMLLVAPDKQHSDHRHVLDLVDLTERAGKKRVSQFSKGMKQRLSLALAIVRSPRLLILDEPFSGLDFLGRQEVREILLGLKNTGMTMILSSHHTFDLSFLCDEFCLLHRGSVVAMESMDGQTPEDLEKRFLRLISESPV